MGTSFSIMGGIVEEFSLRYVTCACIPRDFGVHDLWHVSAFWAIQDSFQVLAFCASTGPRIIY